MERKGVMVLLTTKIVQSMNRIRLLSWVGAFESAMGLLQEIRKELEHLQRENRLGAGDSENRWANSKFGSQSEKLYHEIEKWIQRIQMYMQQVHRPQIENLGNSVVSINRRQPFLYEVRGIVQEEFRTLDWRSGGTVIDWAIGRAERLVAYPGQEISVRIASKSTDGLVGRMSFWGLGVFRGYFYSISRLQDAVWTWLRASETGGDIAYPPLDDGHRRFIHGCVERLVGLVYQRE